ncbi:MAG TPA: aconitate hydratase [Thermoanaerobaculaceae bacterium]|nr:aconitate hydratase [Thermoanaerobaculaceae bacterium]
MAAIESTPEFVKAVYDRTRSRLKEARARLKRPLTLTEKIVLGHLEHPDKAELDPGVAYIELRPDRVAMQDATAQMALMQFMLAGMDRTAVPTTVHCDHLIRARSGAAADVARAVEENKEVYAFLESASARYGIGFWKPGSGIIHQVVLENYAFPGGMMIGTDSHTPNAGGLGMFASGVGGADAVDVMSGFPWEVLQPKLIGVRLTGKLSGWTAPKDVILKLLELLTVKGGTNAVVEFFGPGCASISCTGKGTITNMGAEHGATTSVFPYDARMETYLRATRRGSIADLANANRDLLAADPEVEARPDRFFHRVVEIDLSALEPHLVGPHTPDLARPLSKVPAAAKENGYPVKISAALVGSCTNSSYEDITRAAAVAREALAAGVKARVPLLITPGSEQVYATIERDGLLEVFKQFGATVLANACGPCIGQWQRDDVAKGTPNTIVNSFNRNFPARNDGSTATLSFIASPEVVVAYSVAGTLAVNPVAEQIPVNGHSVRLSAPPAAPEVPERGFVFKAEGYVAPPASASSVAVKVREGSDRLQFLTPFPAWDGRDYVELPVILKAKGKCTTDHISPAGPWLKFRGHLDNISNNLFLGAVNAFSGEPGKGKHPLTGEVMEFSKIARDLKGRGMRWVAVGDENYGEGSSREHAAMEPRHLGGVAVIARSFARIHETNLKKQGLLPLAFGNAADYDKVREGDRVSVVGLASLAPGKPVKVVVHHADGSSDEITCRHTLNAEQVGWFRAGSALNVLRSKK